MRKFKEVKRKEIIYSLSEWKQIERAAAKASMQTSEYIRRMSLNGEITYLNMEGVTPVINAMRIMGKLTAEYKSARQEVNKLSEKLSKFEVVEKQVGAYFDLLEKSKLSEAEQLQLKMYGSLAERCNITNRDGLQRVEKLRKDTSEKVDPLKEQMNNCKKLYDTYVSISDTYQKISEGDYISNLIAEKKREEQCEQKPTTAAKKAADRR